MVSQTEMIMEQEQKNTYESLAHMIEQIEFPVGVVTDTQRETGNTYALLIIAQNLMSIAEELHRLRCSIEIRNELS